jgi:hypothetical protein
MPQIPFQTYRQPTATPTRSEKQPGLQCENIQMMSLLVLLLEDMNIVHMISVHCKRKCHKIIIN